jgi:hypothetical protein
MAKKRGFFIAMAWLPVAFLYRIDFRFWKRGNALVLA